MTLSLHPVAAAATDGLPGLATASMLTSDGTRLDADIWTPPGDGPCPVLLMRQAYGRRLGSALCYAHPAWYARHGFMVVVQDVRGRGSSEGSFVAFENDAQDGAEAVGWAAELPRSNGHVGMYGFSYQGTNQLLAAALRPPALKAMAPAMIGWDLHADWATEGDGFRLASNVGWGLQMAAGTAQHEGAEATWKELYAASRAPASLLQFDGRPAVLDRYRAFGHYADWLERDSDDPYWARISPGAHLSTLRDGAIPSLFIGGWFDTHLPGTLAAFEALRDANAALLIGPWTHFPWDRLVGDHDFGPEAASPVDRIQLQWFRRWLIDEADVAPQPMVSMFDMAENRWQHRSELPSETIAFHLGGSGLASIDTESGTLTAAPAGETGIEYLVHDPWRPAPSVGGAFGTPPGAVDRARIDQRSDILVFTTAPLEAPMALLGKVEAVLSLVSDCPGFDLACTLSRIDAHGRVIQLAEGFRSLRDHQAGVAVTVSLRMTCATLPPGERLRLSIAAASFPAYPVNPGDGRRPVDVARGEAKLITLGIMTGGSAGSMLHLTIDSEWGA
jgi:putative CocE/NonD family hydrolase